MADEIKAVKKRLNTDNKAKAKVEADFKSTQTKMKKCEHDLAKVDEAIEDLNNLGKYTFKTIPCA